METSVVFELQTSQTALCGLPMRRIEMRATHSCLQVIVCANSTQFPEQLNAFQIQTFLTWNSRTQHLWSLILNVARAPPRRLSDLSSVLVYVSRNSGTDFGLHMVVWLLNKCRCYLVGHKNTVKADKHFQFLDLHKDQPSVSCYSICFEYSSRRGGINTSSCFL
jgi:hypothetical protein